MINWDTFILLNHFSWTQILFVVVIALETGIALCFGKRLFSGKPKVAKEIYGIDNQCQKVSPPIRPFSIPSNRGTNTKNNKESNP